MAKKRKASAKKRKAPAKKRKPISRRVGSSKPTYRKRRKLSGSAIRKNTVKDWTVMVGTGALVSIPLKVATNYLDKTQGLSTVQRVGLDIGLVALPLLASMKNKKLAKYLVPISAGYGLLSVAGYATEYILKDSTAILGRGGYMNGGTEFMNGGKQFMDGGVEFAKKTVSQKVAEMKSEPMAGSGRRRQNRGRRSSNL